jgi:hypothetical protein
MMLWLHERIARLLTRTTAEAATARGPALLLLPREALVR